MKTHELKIWPEFFDAVRTGAKRFEVRVDDRGGFNVGDILWLREWDRVGKQYMGRELKRCVTFVMDGKSIGPFPPLHGYVILSIAEE